MSKPTCPKCGTAFDQPVWIRVGRVKCGECGEWFSIETSRPAPEAAATKYPGQGSPWADYLHHRARALRWQRDEMGKNPEAIARDMTMDSVQVRLILMTVDQHPEEYEP